MFQNGDGRIVFVIPYQDDFTLIGTTDRDYQGDPAEVKASDEEIDYLCTSVDEYLARPIKPEDVVWAYSGVRPLYDDGASEAKSATREYVFELDTPGGAPLLSVYGGKITTHRRLAEEALEKLAPYLKGTKARKDGPRKAPLPGGDMEVTAVAELSAQLLRRLSVPRCGKCEPSRACLRHARCEGTGGGEIGRRSRPMVRRWPDRGRDQLSDARRNGLARRKTSYGAGPSLDCA